MSKLMPALFLFNLGLGRERGLALVSLYLRTPALLAMCLLDRVLAQFHCQNALAMATRKSSRTKNPPPPMLIKIMLLMVLWTRQ